MAFLVRSEPSVANNVEEQGSTTATRSRSLRRRRLLMIGGVVAGGLLLLVFTLGYIYSQNFHEKLTSSVDSVLPNKSAVGGLSSRSTLRSLPDRTSMNIVPVTPTLTTNPLQAATLLLRKHAIPAAIAGVVLVLAVVLTVTLSIVVSQSTEENLESTSTPDNDNNIIDPYSGTVEPKSGAKNIESNVVEPEFGTEDTGTGPDPEPEFFSSWLNLTLVIVSVVVVVVGSVFGGYKYYQKIKDKTEKAKNKTGSIHVAKEHKVGTNPTTKIDEKDLLIKGIQDAYEKFKNDSLEHHQSWEFELSDRPECEIWYKVASINNDKYMNQHVRLPLPDKINLREINQVVLFFDTYGFASYPNRPNHFIIRAEAQGMSGYLDWNYQISKESKNLKFYLDSLETTSLQREEEDFLLKLRDSMLSLNNVGAYANKNVGQSNN